MATMLYEGKAKKIFTTENPNEIVVYYKDDATALNGLKKGTIIDKGVVRTRLSKTVQHLPPIHATTIPFRFR